LKYSAPLPTLILHVLNGSGPDRLHFCVTQEGDPVDEIDDFLNSRYLSAEEAVWRILGFHITHKEPGVMPLPIHLPNSRQNHQYHRINYPNSKLSLLDRYFLRPNGVFQCTEILQDSFDALTYSSYYALFRLDTFDADLLDDPLNFQELIPPPGEISMLVIQQSSSHEHVTRLAPIKQSEGEVFYLRALLNFRPARSFRDLLTVNGVRHPSFQDAAAAHGLFADENEVQYTFRDAIQALSTPSQLRLLFVHLLIHDLCPFPIQIWHEFEDQLSLDHFHASGRNRHLASELTLRDLSRLLDAQEKSLTLYGLPEPAELPDEILHELHRWNARLDLLLNQALHARGQFNAHQHAFFDAATDALHNNRQFLGFLDGRAGRGKTFLLRALTSYIRSQNSIVLPTALPAFAALLIPGGCTAHSAFKVFISALISLAFFTQLIRFRYRSWKTTSS
jgi:hypothetical protein